MSGLARYTGYFFLTVLLIAVGAKLLPAQSPAAANYRRIFVPEDELQTQVRGLLPIKREEFERRVTATGALAAPPAGATARIEEATFRAVLHGSKLDQGDAVLELVSTADRPELVLLEPWNLSLQSATFAGADAAIGIAADGGWRFVAEKSGSLRLSWTKAGQAEAPDAVRFDLRLPRATRRHLEITAPEGAQLSAIGNSIVGKPRPAAESSRIVWPIELSGEEEIRLLAHSRRATTPDTARTFVREETTYSILRSVIDLQTRFSLDLLDAPLTELRLLVPSGLNLIAVRVAGESVPFSLETSDGPKAQLARVELSAPLAGTGQLVEIDSTVEWIGDRTYPLPRLTLMDASLQDGALTVQAPSWLRLQARPLVGCLQSGAASAAAGRAIDQFVFQAYSPDASIEITPNPTLLPLREESGTLIGIQAHQVTGVAIAELTAAGGGARFAVEAELPRHWIIDSVETQPADQLSERLLTVPSQGMQRLQIKLANPLTAQRPLRLILRGHFRRPPNDEVLDDAFFQLARFTDVHDRRQLISVRVDDPEVDLRLDSEAVTRLDSSQLSAADERLFESPPASLLLERSSPAQRIKGVLKPITARYEADAVVRAEVRRGHINQAIAIRCQPETSAATSVIVRLVPRPDAEVTWTIAGGSDSPLPVLVEDGSSGGSDAEEAVYRLLLPRAYSSAFELVGRLAQSYSPGDALSLVFLPAAIRQSGQLQVYAPEGDVFVRPREMRTIPRSPDDAERDALCGRYDYEPGRRSKAVLDTLPSAVIQRRAWIDSLELVSQFSTDGRAQHEARLTVQNRGSRNLRVHLQGATVDCFVAMDGREEQPLDFSHTDNSAVITLPEEALSVPLRIRYAGEGTAPLWPIQVVHVAIPQFDVPVLTKSWRVLLPPGFAVSDKTLDGPSGDPSADQARHTSIAEPLDLPPSRWHSLLQLLSGPALAVRPLLPVQSRSQTGEAAVLGWTEVSGELPSDEEATLRVYSRPVMVAWSMCLIFIVAGLAHWVPSGRWQVAGAGLLAGASLLMASPLSWLIVAVSAGWFVGVLLSLMRRDDLTSSPPRAALQPAGTSLKYAVRTTAIWSLLFFLLMVAWTIRAGADEPAANASAARTLPPVVFPVDGEHQPAGDYVYVEHTFYDELHRADAASASATLGWLLQQAHYAVSALPAGGANGLPVVQLAVELDFQTLAPSQAVVLPWRRQQVTLLQGAQLDASGAELSWDAAGEALRVNVAQPGRHRLELSFAAAARQVEEANLLAIDVPRVAISSVTLPVRMAHATLLDDGTSGRLSMRWPVTGPESTRSEKTAADRLLVWKIRPGSASLESRFRIQPESAPPREAVVSVDPRLRLLPGRTSAPVVAVKDPEAHSTFKVDLSQTAPGPADFLLAWLWPDNIGIGKLSLPDVEIVGYRLEHDWILLSLDAALELDAASRALVLEGAKASEAAAEIARLWPDVDLTGAVLLDRRATQRAAIGVKATEPTPHVVQTTDWSVSRSLAQATCTGEITGIPPTRFEHRIAIPPQAHVSRVTVLQRQRPAALRWAQQREGTLVVSLLEPPAKEQTLSISADLALPGAGGTATLPAFSLMNAVDDQCLVRIHRRTDVQLRLERAPGWIPDGELLPGQERPRLGRIVAALKRQSGQSAAPRVVWSANDPHIRGAIYTRVNEADGDWLADVQLRLEVSGGLVDELRLSVPESWSGPLTVQPAMEQHFEASASEARRQLVLRPSTAMSGEVEITIRGPIHSSSGALQAPDVVLVGEHTIDRYVLVDRGNAGQAIDWDVTGLLPITRGQAPDAPSTWRDAPGDVFRVIGQRFDATAKTMSTHAPSPSATLADVRVRMHLDGQATVEALLTIEPRGASTASFALPPLTRLITVLLDGVAVPCVHGGVRTWTVSVPTEAAAYRLAILYQTAMPPAPHDQAIVLTVPELPDMPVRRTVWTIKGAGIAVSQEPSADELTLAAGQRAQSCTNSLVQLSRFNAAVASLEATAAAVNANVSRAVVRDSFLRWNADLRSLDQRLAAIAGDGGLSQEETSQWQAGIDAAAKVQQRLLQADILAEGDNGQASTELIDATPALHFVVDGGPENLRVIKKRRPQRPSAVSGSMAGLLMVICALFAMAFPWMLRQEPAVRTSLVLAVLSVGWWVAAPFGWLGVCGLLLAASGASVRRRSRLLGGVH